MPEQEEQQTEKKKASILKRILKWFGFGLLTLLLIASILFQGPWKVTTLLAVLIAGAMLPKPYGKYFWLCVGGVVIALIVWVFLPEETEGWRPYTFDKELAELRAKYAVPDSENAAIIYNQLLEDYNKAAFEPNFLDPNLEDLIRKEPWSSKDHPEAAQWLRQQEGTIAKLIEASKIEKCRFPISSDFMSTNDMTNRLGTMNKWARLLTSAANNDNAEGRTKEGLEKYIAVLQMGKHQRQQLSLIDFLVGVGIEALSTNQLRSFVVMGDATEEYLSVIEKALAEIKHDWSYDLPRILDYEKLFVKNFWRLFYEVNPEGKIRLTRSLANTIREQWSQEMKDTLVITYWSKRLMKASTILRWFYMPSTPQKAGEIIDAEYGKFYAMADPDFDWQKKAESPTKMFGLNYRYLVEYIVRIEEPTFYSIHDTYLRYIAQQRGALLTIALRRYKNKTSHWPGSLDEVKPFASAEIFIDPINGGSFIYKLTDENFTLYSKGKNNIDENGKYKEGADDWPIWPTPGKKRKAEKENTDAKQH
jgi:hypothetical protein